MRLIYSKNLTFLSLKIIVETLIYDVRNNTSKHHFLKSIKINTKPSMLSDANVPVRFRAQQQAKYSSLQLTANCIAARRYL